MKIFFLFTWMILSSANLIVAQSYNQRRIQPYSQNQYFWQYDGRPVLLIGGSHEDNLFNNPEGLEQHLDTLKAAGGNYIRNTMSSRKPGNPWAFKKLDNKLYDLEQWNHEYWDRFENLLKLAFDRDIIVQIEIWDPWDFFRSEAALGFGTGNVGWESCPFNPSLNINYTSDKTGLENIIDYTLHTPGKHLFFQTVPALKNITRVLKFQEVFVTKILDISLNYPNVLYNIRNECREHEEWSKYWAVFIKARALNDGKQVFITDMRRSEDFSSPAQLSLLNDREHFNFVDISQNNHLKGQEHYDQILFVRNILQKNPVPMNNIKIYGGIAGWTGGVEEGTHRFWRSIFGGCASARFHREGPSGIFFGIGLNELAQSQIKSMRMLTGEMDFFRHQPSNHLLTNREENQAYCLAISGKEYAIYFTGKGEVWLNASEGEYEVRWLQVETSQWSVARTAELPGKLEAPSDDQWAVLIRMVE